MYCAVVGCKNNNRKNKIKEQCCGDKGFFSFPKEKTICDKWILLCGRTENFRFTNARVCEDHFHDSDFIYSNRRRRIKFGILPSLNLNLPKTQSNKMHNKYQKNSYEIFEISEIEENTNDNSMYQRFSPSPVNLLDDEIIIRQDDEIMTVTNDDNSDDIDYSFKDGNLVEYRIVHLPEIKSLSDNQLSHTSLISDNSGGGNLTQQYFVISATAAANDNGAVGGGVVGVPTAATVNSDMINTSNASIEHDTNIYVNSPTRIAPQPIQITGNVIVKNENGISFSNATRTAAGTTRSIAAPLSQAPLPPTTTRLIPLIDTKPKMKKRDDRRRANHNEIERRRRDKINHLIMKLGSIIPIDGLPGGESDRPNIANSEGQSKGLILSKACEYIETLNIKVNSLNECLQKEKPTVGAGVGQTTTNLTELRHLREVNKRLRMENSLLKAKLSELNNSKPMVISLIDDDDQNS